MGLVEITPLAEREEMAPRVGREHKYILLIHGQSFSNLENDPGWVVPFQSKKWFENSNGQAFSS